MRHCTRKGLSAQAVEAAMVEHDGLVQAFIRRQGGGDIAYEEALQAGRIGLWHAIQGYDLVRGARFSTYAWMAICRQIHRRVRELKRERDREALEMLPSSPDRASRDLSSSIFHQELHLRHRSSVAQFG